MTLEDELLRSLVYEPETGQIRCASTGQRKFYSAGSGGYLRGRCKSEVLYAHRVAWLLHHGRWPEGQIDHVNRDRTDNRISNLRDVTHAENMGNKKRYRTNSSGVAGVYYHRQRGRWAATLRKKTTYHRTLEEAIASRQAMLARSGFHPNHGVDDLAA